VRLALPLANTQPHHSHAYVFLCVETIELQEMVIESVAQAIKAAYDDLKPAAIGVGWSPVCGFLFVCLSVCLYVCLSVFVCDRVGCTGHQGCLRRLEDRRRRCWWVLCLSVLCLCLCL
jgi:hypothetical protein